MAFKLEPVVAETHILDKTDQIFKNEGQPTSISVRRATQAQESERSRLMAKVTQEITQETIQEAAVRLQNEYSREDVKELEIYLTLCDANILTDKDKELFKFKGDPPNRKLTMSKGGFLLALGKLPSVVVAEMHEKVLETNQHWGPEGEVS